MTSKRSDSPLRSRIAAALAVLLLLGLGLAPEPALAVGKPLPGLQDEVRVLWDAQGVPHIYASSDLDAVFMLGYVHAQDRFFQMDVLRRQFSGTLAELVGPAALPSDIQLRTLGLRRGAEATMAAISGEGRDWFEAYAKGVNTYLAQAPLPVEYQALELTTASVPPWVPADSVVIGKALAFGLSFDLDDLDFTVDLATYQAVGAVAGFDGAALFFEDIYRSAPFDPTVSIPAPPGGGAPGGGVEAARQAFYDSVREATSALRPETLELARTYLERAAGIPALEEAVRRRDTPTGSNWWLVSGRLSETGYPMLANDPHLALDTPSIFYEAHLLSFEVPRWRPMIVNGVTFPGTPVVALGCNRILCWGATTNPMDVTDVYQEEIVLDPATGVPAFTRYQGELEPIVVIPQHFRTNQPGNGAANDLVDAGIGPADGGLTFIVPRRNNGPILSLDASDPANVVGLSVQYTGWGPTFELEAFRRWMRARSLETFREGLDYFDFGSQNWAYADTLGNIAYFTSAEMPIREDLQAGGVNGLPPYFIRNGTGGNEWLPVQNPQPEQVLPYEILPFEEMPQVVNPEQGFVANANNDPVGTSLDNSPLNQLRPGGGLYYLSPGYADLRIGRIDALLRSATAGGEKLSVEDLQRMQANNQMLDAELLVPFVLEAFANASAAGAPAELADLAADSRVAEAVERFSNWDFSTPTGLTQGFDPGDDASSLAAPSEQEVAYSVAATIYSTWRGQMVRSVIDETLTAAGLGGALPGSRQGFRALAHHLQSFDARGGIGASGLDFFGVTGAASPEVARDQTILEAVQGALDLLAGEAFEAAFGGSRDQDDYRWGLLHRIVFDHPLGGPFSVPGAGGLESVSPQLPGIARAGGFETVDASGHGTRAADANGFTFGSGPARRFVGVMKPGAIEAYQVIPGGQSGDPTSDLYADQLRLWLTNAYHPLHLSTQDVRAARVRQRVFTPAK